MQKLQKKVRAYLPIIVAVAISLALGAFAGPLLVRQPLTHASLIDDVRELLRIEEGEPIKTEEGVQNAPATSHEQAIVSAVQAAAPAVVSIIVSKDVPIIERCPADPFSGLPEEFRRFFGERYQYTVPCERGTERAEVGGGSGFVISADGYIVTNKHVVSDEDAAYTVLMNDGRKFDARVLARHPSLDIAIVKISGSNFPVVRLGDSERVQLGQTAIAIGNSLGEFRNTVSTGIVSGLARSVTAQSTRGEVETIEDVIQTDAAINPGNSGGPLINSSGEVIGINTAMVSGAQSIGFAIPINAAKRSIESVNASGTIRVAFLGIRYELITDAVREERSLPDTVQGAYVAGSDASPAVEPGSPADQAGIREGDILVAMDGKSIDVQHSPAYVISQHSPGDEITVEILRGDEKISKRVQLGERKDN